MNNIVVRPAMQADLPTLLEFEQCIIAAERPFNPVLKSGHINYYDLKSMIDAPDIGILVAETDGKLVGSGYARIENAEIYLKHRQHAYLGFMYVLPEYRGRGINRMIVDALEQWSLSKGINELLLEVYHNNEAAIRAYEKAGFSGYLNQMRKRDLAGQTPLLETTPNNGVLGISRYISPFIKLSCNNPTIQHSNF